MFIYFTMIQVYELSLLYAPQRNKKWFINLFWECYSQCKNCSSNKNFLAKLKRPLTFGMITCSPFAGINGFLSVKYLRQYLAHRSHASISCYDDGDVILDETVIWEKTKDLYRHFHTSDIKGLLCYLPVNNKHVKVECLVWFYQFIPITVYSFRSSHEFQKHNYLYYF